MLKRVALVGLVLLFAGIAALEWVLVERKKEQRETAFYNQKYGSDLQECFRLYSEWMILPPEERAQSPFVLDKNIKNKTEAQALQEQKGRLKADLDKLAAGETETYPFADFLYGKSWQEELRGYKKQKERNEFILTSSIVCASIGGTIFVCCLLFVVARLIIRGVLFLWRLLVGVSAPQRKTKDKEFPGAGKKAGVRSIQQNRDFRERRSEVKKHSRVLVNSGWQGFGEDAVNSVQMPSAYIAGSIRNKFHSSNLNRGSVRERLENQPVGGSGRIAALLSGKETDVAETSSPDDLRSRVTSSAVKEDRAKSVQKANLPDSRDNFHKLEESLKAQTENLEKQMAEFKQMAQNVQQATVEHSRPIDNALKELTEQIVAIREYTASQQEKVRRLQDGYDWNIIKNFCMRIIRCIDNLDERIARLSEEDVETVHLKEVRDELIFLLEASGIEQFEPEINSDYREQEKFAEAIKEKQEYDDISQIGKIAEVVRAGYQYFIDDENFKIVRPAQVKLFG